MLRWFNQRTNPQSAPPIAAPAPVELNLIVAQGTQAIIDVALDAADTMYQSTILRTDAAAGTILIDELFPAGASARPGQPVRIALRLDGGRRDSFVGTLVDQKRQEGNVCWLVKLPPTVGYVQRRSAYRLKLSPHRHASAEFFLGDYGQQTANLRDLSALGLRLQLPQWLPLQKNTVLEELTFRFAGCLYQCNAAVRNVREDGAAGVEFGVAFLDLPRAQQRALERAIMQSQRAQMQHLAVAG